MKNLLITGGTGLLAINIAEQLKNQYNITLVTNSKEIKIDGVSCTKFNLEKNYIAKEEIKKISPDIVLNCAGMTSVEECENHNYDAFCANTLIPKVLAQVTSDLNIKLVHISTDHFSKGDQKNSSEEDIDIPINTYAQTKFNGEVHVQNINKDALIIRTNFYGWGHRSRESFSDFIINNLKQNKSITLFNDVFYTPINVVTLVKSIENLMKDNKSGIYNIVGNERVSKYQFGVKLAEAFNLNTSLIKQDSINKFRMTKRPKDLSLSNNKLKSEYPNLLNSLEEDITLLKVQETNGVKNRLYDSVQTPDKNKMIYYGKQTIDDKDIDSMISTLTKDFLTQGPTIAEFESRIAEYVGSKYAVAVANLTAGFHIGTLALNLGPSDAIITSPISFVTTSNVALYTGATPIFVDIDPETLNIDLDKTEDILKENSNIKAIYPVHFAGSPCDMERLAKIAKKYNAVIMEDAAHALGANYKCGDRIGSCKYSLAAGFSFHPVKSITCGEGGVITTNNKEFYLELCRLRSHGIQKGNDEYKNKELAFTNGVENPWYYEMHKLGYNYRITDIQCSLGITQLNKLDELMNKRKSIAAIYDKEFQTLKNARPYQVETRQISGNHLYILNVDFESLKITKNDLFKEFRLKGIALHVHYIPIPLQPYYQEAFGKNAFKIDNAIKYYESAVTLPIFPRMTDEQVDQVVSIVKEIIG